MLNEAWPTTLNFVLSNSRSWLNSFASHRSHGVKCQGVAEPCDTHTVRMCFSACCFSSYSTKQSNSTCYQWLGHASIIGYYKWGWWLYKCLTPVLEVVSPLERLQLSFATPCTICVCVRVGTSFFFLAAVHKAEYWKHLLAGVITVHFYANISSCAKCSRTCNN